MPVTPIKHASGAAVWMWLAALLALAAAHLLNFTTQWDDAFISFRIAEHWAQSGEFSYNPGRLEPVATNFLWVVLLAGLNKLTGLTAPHLASILGAAAGLLIPAVLFLGLRRLERSVAGAPAALVCLAAPVWAAWPLSGLETSLFSLLILTAALALLDFWREPRRGSLLVSGVLFGLAALTRPDGLLFAALTFIILIIRHTSAVRIWLGFAAAFAAVFTPGAGYQWLTFHSWAPNAFYAKINGLAGTGLGRTYLKNFLNTYRLAYLAPFILPAFADGRRSWDAWYPAVLILAWSAWIVAVGGDFMPYHRFFAPVWPLLCLLLGLGLDGLAAALRRAYPGLRHSAEAEERGRRSTRDEAGRGADASAAGGTTAPRKAPTAGGADGILVGGITALLALLVLMPTYRGVDHDRVKEWSGIERDRKRVGQWLGTRYPATDGLALKPAGIIPYYSGLNAVDFYSLVDSRAARDGEWVRENWAGHQRVGVERALAWEPRLVILDERLLPPDRLPEPDAGEGAVERAWRADPRSRNYTPVRAEVEPGRWLQYFVRK